MSMEGVVEQVGAAPCVAEVILGAGAEGGGELFAVDEEFFIALTPPVVAVTPCDLGALAAAGIPDVQVYAAESSPALRGEDCPVGPAGLVFRD